MAGPSATDRLSFLRKLEKAEIHVHLEGSIVPETLLEIEPSLTLDEILAHYSYQDFQGFMQAYKWVNLFLTKPEHYALAVRRLGESLHRQGCVYAEVNISIGVLLWRNQPFEPFFDAIAGEAARSPIPLRFIFDAARQFGVEAADAVLRHAIEEQHRGVIAFGLGGDEARGPAAAFRPHFDQARAAGLRVLPHAGETTGPKTIWDSLAGGATRIGHGIRAIEDTALMAHLRDHDIPLEVCISSNVCTGSVASLREPPVRRLYDAGVPIVLNSDDPPMFHTTLLGEYDLAMREFGFTEAEMRLLAGNSLKYSFRNRA
jgi:aminodeoxyfutalosine deaminase